MIDKRKWELQLFADDVETGDADTGDVEHPEAEDTENPAEDAEEESKPEPEKKYTDADVDEIVKKKIAAERAKAKKEAEEAAKKAKMTAEQKQQYELEKANERIAELEAAELRHELSSKAAELLKEEKIDATADILKFVVGADEDTTKDNVKAFVSIVQAQVKAAEIERAKGTTPKKYGNSGNEQSEIEKRIAKYKTK